MLTSSYLYFKINIFLSFFFCFKNFLIHLNLIIRIKIVKLNFLKEIDFLT